MSDGRPANLEDFDDAWCKAVDATGTLSPVTLSFFSRRDPRTGHVVRPAQDWDESVFRLEFADPDLVLSHLGLVVRPYPSADFRLHDFAADRQHGHPSSRDTSSEEAWLTARTWADQCLQDHEACNEVHGPQWYPTRLLDIGDTSASTDTVRLVLRDVDHLAGPYVTLSHCWGNASFVTLTTTNFEMLRGGVSILMLAQTFQDTLVIARRLGIRYVWIDSMCILQDLESDWQAESLLMERVYSEGYCNIAATASIDSTGGLFRRRQPDLLCPIVIKQPDLVNGKDCRTYVCVDFNYWLQMFDEAPLCRRAWVLQERLLARRVLHFTEREIMWECKELTASEAYPSGYPGYRGPSPRDMNASVSMRQVKLDGDGDDYMAQWSKVQNFYSMCALTRGTDKLVALSGIAKKFQAMTKDTYVAGMWQQHLPQQLLWHTMHGAPVDSILTMPDTQQSAGEFEQEEWRAPSWSWASIDHATTLSELGPQLRLLIKVDNVRIRAVSDDTTGMLREASLQLHGVLKAVSFKPRIKYADEYGRYFWWDTHIARRRLDSKDGDAPFFLDHPGPDLSALSMQNVLFCMPSVLRRQPRRSEWLESLVLQLLDHDRAIYRRIGVIHATTKDTVSTLMATQPEERSYPCLQYSEESPYHHAVRLI